MVLVLAVQAFRLTIPWHIIAALIALNPLSSLAAQLPTFRTVSERNLIGLLLLLDTLIHTAILCLAGGPTNPFTIVYLLYVVLAAVVLTAAWTWIIAFFSSVGFGALFLFSQAIPEWNHHGPHHGFSLHLYGMLAAYVTVAVLVSYFLNRIVGELRRKERRLQQLEQMAANQQRLTSLTTMAAGAAHELGTPLATIAIVSHELERSLKKELPHHVGLLEDIALLKSETARCKRLLQELSEKSGDLLGEQPQMLKVADLVEEAIAPLKYENAPLIEGDTEFILEQAPRKALAVAVRALIKNALEASESSDAVVVSSQFSADDFTLEVLDRGSGMSEEILERVGEPFFSTKGPDRGMGLGIYLARLTAEQLGGSLTFASVHGQGTSARLVLPRNLGRSREAA